MKALKHGRWGSYLATLQTTNVTNSVWSNAMKSECFISLTTSRYLRNHTMTPLRSAGQRSLEDSTFEPEISQNVGVTGQSVPYLEAYNLMEENADIIFDQGNMMNERAYNIDEVHLKDSLNPRPASELPGPKSWPMVGCLPYMIRHKDFDPQKVYLFWRTVRKEFGPIFRKDMPGHPNLVFITDPADLQVMLQSTMYNPIRPGMQSLKKIRGRGGADGKTNTYYHIFGDKAGILAE
ncbi:hypothetical protein SK128_022720 [Halocaridina rubra]|uniref:Uncharacterized protein n=1 Tax=Halocaridina rubra TaxID=373956 RepID=A0AAN8WPL1_HALRR